MRTHATRRDRTTNLYPSRSTLHCLQMQRSLGHLPKLLSRSRLRNTYSHIRQMHSPHKIFWPYAAPPSKLPDESRRQRPYQGAKYKFLVEYVEQEVKAHRFSCSVGGTILPGMACMPVHVAQNATRTKFRTIYDHSAGGPHSLNSLIPESERSAQVDRIDALIHAFRSRQLNPDDIILFKSDVSRAFRNLPMSPYWQALQAVKINGRYYIDRCNTFGNAGSQRIFCAFYSLVLWIAENTWRLSDIFSYVDDNFSWEYSDRMQYYRPYGKKMPQKQARLLELWDILHIPHAVEKQEFSPVITITGFRVDLRQMRVSVSDKRCQLLTKSLLELAATPSVTLHDCQSISGSLNWVFEVNPFLRMGITSLHSEMGRANKSYGQVVITKRVASDLRWLARLLCKSRGVHFTRTIAWRPEDAYQTAYTHASTEGFGFWFPSTRHAYYYRFNAPIEVTFVSPAHTFALICAIHTATKSWIKGADGRPGRLALFTQDEATIKMFDKLHASDELHPLLLLGMKLLMKVDIDHVVSKAGNKHDFAFTARLSSEPKDVLDVDYPDVRFRVYDIPTKLARRVPRSADPQISIHKGTRESRRISTVVPGHGA